MENYFDRTKVLLGEEALENLATKKVAVIGLGGVGSYVCEALARCGIGHLIIADKDVVDETNINRQLYALTSTIGIDKVTLAKQRVLDINPRCTVESYKCFIDVQTIDKIIPADCNYIVDAIDTLTSKMALVHYAKQRQIPIICSMGMGNKTDPTQIMVSDIHKTSVDPLAKVMRKLCRDAEIKQLKVVYSKEDPLIKRTPPASIIFVPASAGLLLAREVVFSLI